jgi:hypothetical protein
VYKSILKAKLAYLYVLLVLLHLRIQPNISHSAPLHSMTWQPISDTGLTDALND